MSARRQWTIVGAILVVAGVGLTMAARGMGDRIAPVRVGSAAPDFRAMTVVAPLEARTLADYRGEVVLLNLWATWCIPCRTEMPSIQSLHEAFAPRGLRVLAVSVDESGMEQAIRDFGAEYKLSFTLLHDATGEIERAYQSTGVPETYLIARDGTIRKRVVGATDWASDGNRALVRALLDEPRP
ncbi:MAG: TlpA family protein disulfide reductase [Gemmatimonadaceae bacterium]|nr:TlpA family protein disulfide reductase [Gemmatimonadaceae bacterium]